MMENQTTHQSTPPESGQAPRPPGPVPSASPPRPPLRRSHADRRVLGGVATGIADWLGIDPVLVRVAFVVLAVFGGSGILVYLALWLFLPEEGQPESAGERFLRDNTALAVVLAVLLTVFVVAPALTWSGWGPGPGFVGVIVLVAAVVAVVALVRRDTPSTSAGTSPQPAPAAAPTVAAAAPTRPYQAAPPPGWPPAVAPLPSPPPPPPQPPRDKSVLGPLTVGVLLVTAGVLVMLGLTGVAGISAVVIVSSALLVVALGLLVGTFAGRARGLIALGVVLVLALVPLAAVPRELRAGDGAGERVFRPTTLAELRGEYRLGAGELTLDLTNLDLGGTSHDVDVSVGAGQIRVWLPDQPTGVEVDAQVGVGSVALPGAGEQGGLGVERSWSDNPDDAAGNQLDLELHVGIGQVEVHQSIAAEVTR